MPNFYNPNGNFEVWREKPDGYFTAEEWVELNPAEETTPTPPTLGELRLSALCEIKRLLESTDYKQFKFNDGDLTAEEYEPIRLQRINWRAIYNTIENATDIAQITAVWPEVE